MSEEIKYQQLLEIAGEFEQLAKLTDKEACQLLREKGLVVEAQALHGECVKVLGRYTAFIAKEEAK